VLGIGVLRLFDQLSCNGIVHVTGHPAQSIVTFPKNIDRRLEQPNELRGLEELQLFTRALTYLKRTPTVCLREARVIWKYLMTFGAVYCVDVP
jgi:hypothetical protein